MRSPFLISPSCAGTALFSHIGHPSTDRGATTGFRFDGELAHQLQSLAQADKAYAATVDRDLLVKANAQVNHGQL